MSPPFRWCLAVAGLAGLYALAAYIGFQVAFKPGNVSPVWPASGIALAALIMWPGRHLWLGVWLGSILANTWFFLRLPQYDSGIAPDLAMGTCIGAGASLQAVIGARLSGNTTGTDSVSGAARLLFGGGLTSCIVSPSIGVTALWAGGFVATPIFGYTWLTWWLGDAVGVLLFAPLLLAWRRAVLARPTTAWIAELVLFTSLLVIALEFVLATRPALLFLILPFTAWAALRFGPRMATLAVFFIAARAILAVALGQELFSVAEENVAYLMLEAFVGTTTVSSVLLMAVESERAQAHETLLASNADLETRVETRTSALTDALAELKRAHERLRHKMAEALEANQRADRVFEALAKVLPGTVLDGRYRLDAPIATGGFGVVFRGICLSTNRTVAIKVFQPQPGNATVDARNRFLREGIWASRVIHPNAVEVLAYGISNEEIPYLVMELLSGHTLAAEIRDLGRLTLDRCIEVLVPVCAVLEAAHTLGITHRDVKPANIFLHREGEGEIVKLIDFGLAKSTDSATVDWIPDSFGDTGDHVTRTGQLLGTPLYMAPEQVGGAPCDGRADVYSLGMVLYVALCGAAGIDSQRQPAATEANGGPAHSWLHAVPLRPVRQLRPEVPEAVESLLTRMLSPNPAERPRLPAISQTLQSALTASV